jgi:hypothetical protein
MRFVNLTYLWLPSPWVFPDGILTLTHDRLARSARVLKILGLQLLAEATCNQPAA